MLAGMWTTLLDLVLPRTCPGCGTGVPWCAGCATQLAGRPRRVLPPPSDEELSLPPIYALARYRGPVRSVVLAAKEHGRRDLPDVLGTALGVGLARLAAIAVITAPSVAGAGAHPARCRPPPRR